MYEYFAVVDDQHDVKDPVTVIRAIAGAGPDHVLRLNDDAAWVPTGLLGQIEAGEVPYRIRSIGLQAAARIRKRREKKITFRYSILVDDDDPTDRPQGALREWDASNGDHEYAETYTREGEWVRSLVRLNIERGSDIRSRIVPSDGTTVYQFIDSLQRRWSR